MTGTSAHSVFLFMTDFHFVQDTDSHLMAPHPNRQTHPPPFIASTYTDIQGRDWPYWPLTEADHMWRDVRCNQFNCPRTAVFVGVVDVLGDGALYYDSAAAWCYFCVPREAMTPEAERMARHAEWARQVAIGECLAFIRRFRDEEDINEGVDAILTRLIGDLRSATETREQVLAYATLPAEYLDGRMQTQEMRYAVRPGSGMDATLRPSNVSEIS